MPRFGFSAPLLLFVTAVAAIAQVERASIIGNVSDTTGAVMPGVALTVTNEDTNTRIQMVTDDAGAYTAVNLIPGSYRVNAVRSGFKPVVFRNFVLQVGQTARLDIGLEVGGVDQTVEVTGTVSLLQTESVSVG